MKDKRRDPVEGARNLFLLYKPLHIPYQTQEEHRKKKAALFGSQVIYKGTPNPPKKEIRAYSESLLMSPLYRAVS